MGDKFVKRSGARATMKTHKSTPSYWCGCGSVAGMGCDRNCQIDKGKSLKKTKQTRRNYHIPIIVNE
jgi:hypothetical protein